MVDETKQTEKVEEKPQEQPADNTGAGNFTPTSTLLDRADMLVQRLEKANVESTKATKAHGEVAFRLGKARTQEGRYVSGCHK